MADRRVVPFPEVFAMHLAWHLACICSPRTERRIMAEPRQMERAALLEKVRRLRWEMKRIVRALEKAEFRADSVLLELKEIEETLAQDGPSRLPCVGARRTSRKPVNGNALLKLAAEKGTDDFGIRPLSDGAGAVHVDGSEEFRLPPTLAVFAGILAMGKSKPDNGLVGWKSLPLIASLLEKKTGRKFSKRAIRQLTFRLRMAFAVLGGVNPYLVQTHKQYGLRIAVRCKAPGNDASPGGQPDSRHSTLRSPPAILAA